MKLHTFIILNCLCASAWAAEPAPAAPPAHKEAPPAANSQSNEVVPGEAQVTISRKADMTVEEYRVGGRLYMIKITPKHGKPYYLVDDRGDGRFARQDPLDFGLRPPMWVIKKF
jgi:hypothetical protein